ncbi:type VII toxin-antitoxin system HepT family RNase toxin [Geoalkalibacter halelectricus]|uniref:DUF86 domain-containing protein n=1 Tax=Geoalkalibacter halelectricus TaxID=2847045 RepID=A0ABY5ZRM6_9BACT|nr:DUF86 domain-containing protein [Geoalkalibacter halelectricus]MDO3376771.1 DUF86 domain-containing protein [Geoalkalibacter halelectricus]UWZ81278.1 DUF86 domain-containing protein [Geoalkalibacter halelectricus]
MDQEFVVVNKAVFLTRLERLREYLELLEKVAQFPVERFVQDPFVYGTAERHLHLAIECLLDIGNHIISDRGYPKPDTYADIFRILREHDVIPESLLRELDGMAAFRNVLVHDYVRLDRKRVHDIIHEKLVSMKKLGEIFAKMI